jgi:hypothetical protein
MLKKTITYSDYNGVSRTEDFYFNLSKAELMEMELSTAGGLEKMITSIVAAQDTPSIIKVFKELILKAYGEKSLDGKEFIKEDADGHLLCNKFKQSEAYSVLFMELATNSDAATAFINGITPKIDEVKEAAPSAAGNVVSMPTRIS